MRFNSAASTNRTCAAAAQAASSAAAKRKKRFIGVNLSYRFSKKAKFSRLRLYKIRLTRLFDSFLPDQRRRAEDGGVLALNTAGKQFYLVLEDEEHVLLHEPLRRFEDQLAGLRKSAEEENRPNKRSALGCSVK